MFYCLAVLALAGGSGIWVPAVIPSKTVGIDSLTTFVMATLAPIGADLLLNIESTQKVFSKLWRTGLLLAFAAAISLAFISLLREKQGDEWTTGWLGVFLSLVIWMAVKLKSGDFDPEPDIDGSIGGDLKPPTELAGKGLE
jgi:hypothetical protein